MSLIFIAIPTKGTVSDGALTETFLRYLAKLHLENPQHTFIAPMVQDYQILKYMPEISRTWEVLGRHCQDIIERVDIVWVLTFDGWVTSLGVDAEIDHARKHHKPITYIDPSGKYPPMHEHASL